MRRHFNWVRHLVLQRLKDKHKLRNPAYIPKDNGVFGYSPDMSGWINNQPCTKGLPAELMIAESDEVEASEKEKPKVTASDWVNIDTHKPNLLS